MGKFRSRTKANAQDFALSLSPTKAGRSPLTKYSSFHPDAIKYHPRIFATHLHKFPTGLLFNINGKNRKFRPTDNQQQRATWRRNFCDDKFFCAFDSILRENRDKQPPEFSVELLILDGQNGYVFHAVNIWGEKEGGFL